jgi:hypothetical protein
MRSEPRDQKGHEQNEAFAAPAATDRAAKRSDTPCLATNEPRRADWRKTQERCASARDPGRQSPQSPRRSFHFVRTCSCSALLASATAGNSARKSNGRQASMIAFELNGARYG